MVLLRSVMTSGARCLARIVATPTTSAVRANAHRASIGAINRAQFLRRYPALLVKPDGSTVPIRASEPIELFALPVDLKKLSEDERRQMLAARKPKTKRIVQEKIDDNFDSSDYMSLFRAPSSGKPRAKPTLAQAPPTIPPVDKSSIELPGQKTKK